MKPPPAPPSILVSVSADVISQKAEVCLTPSLCTSRHTFSFSGHRLSALIYCTLCPAGGITGIFLRSAEMNYFFSSLHSANSTTEAKALNSSLSKDANG